MTATRPTTTMTARYNPVNQTNNNNDNSNHNNNVAKRTRGPINKRACQRCRQGKIKCDGDAETGKACSNCDPQHCKYDNSPRKNKQVESLKTRLNLVEEQLINITNEVSEQLHTKDMEKEILCLLYESKVHFTGFEPLFEGLKEALKQSRFVRPILPIAFELLKRLGDVDCIPKIMESLQRFVDCANSDPAMIPTLSSSAEMFKKIEENYQPYQSNDDILPVNSMLMQNLTIPTTEVDLVNLNLHSGGEDDNSSESHSGGLEYADDTSGGGPATPPNAQQVHSESKCFNSNNVQQHMVATSSASDFVAASNFYNDYQYYPNQFNVMENNFSMNGMNFLSQTTTSPTDEQMFHLSN